MVSLGHLGAATATTADARVGNLPLVLLREAVSGGSAALHVGLRELQGCKVAARGRMDVRLLDEAVLGLVDEGTRVECAGAPVVVLHVPLVVPRAAAGRA